MSVKQDIPMVSMNNTKKELLDAYAEVKRRVEVKNKELLSAEKARAEAEQNASKMVAEKEVEGDPVKRLHELRGSLGKELLALAEQFEQEVLTFEQVRSAVQSKQEELKSLYGFEVEIGGLAELITLHNEQKGLFSQQILQEKEAFKREVEEQRNLWEQEQKAVAERVDEARSERKRKWMREQEEYDYTLTRERAQRRDELDDELTKLMQESIARKQEFEISCQSREDALQQQENMVSEREKTLDDLHLQIKGFDNIMNQTVQKEVESNATRLMSEFDAKYALGKATHEGQCQVFKGRVESLEQLVETQAKQIEQLSVTQESAYQKVQDIASRAVDSARREVVISPALVQKTAEG